MRKKLNDSKIKELIEKEGNPEMKKKLQEMVAKLRSEKCGEDFILLRIRLISSRGMGGGELQKGKAIEEEIFKYQNGKDSPQRTNLRNSKIYIYIRILLFPLFIYF